MSEQWPGEELAVAGTAAAPPASPAKNAQPDPWPGQEPAPITDTGTTMGFADEAPQQASSQLSPEDTATFYKMLRGEGLPRASAKELRDFVASKGHSLTNADDIVRQRDAGLGVVGQIDYPMPKPADPSSMGGAAARGATQGASLGFGDELHGLIAGAGAAVSGGSFGDTYDSIVDADRGRLAADEEQHPYAAIAGNLVGGAALPVGLERAGVTAALDAVGLNAYRAARAEGLGAEDARAIAKRAITRRLATEGSAYGGAYGAGTSDGTPSERLVGAGVGAAEGAAGGAALGGIGQALAPVVRRSQIAGRAAPLTEAQQTMAAADRQGIEMLPADVGGPATRRLTAAAAQAPISASPIINAAQRVLQQGQAAAERIAGPGATDAATAGEAARAGAEGYIARSGQAGGALYDRAARRAGNALIDPVEARQVLDDQIARLEQVPGGGQGLEEARAMRDALNGRFTVQGIRDMRTELFVDPALRGSPMDRRMRQVVDAAARDVENGLRAQGLDDAAGAFRTADNFWRDRLQTIDQVIEPVIGQPGKAKGGEAISKAIDTAAKGDVVKLQRFLGTLPAAERDVVTGSFINRIGMATKGQQNAQGDAFSLSTFLSNWSQLSPRAQAVMFNPEQRAALQDLATVANGVRNASRYANHSNTSGGIWGNLGVLAGGAMANAPVAAAGLGAQLIGGRLLASPRFARWLARAPRTQLSPIAYIDRLTRIARAEPAIAGDVLNLQQRLQQSLAGSRPLAANQEGQGGQPIQPQE